MLRRLLVSLSFLALTSTAGCAATEPREVVDPSTDPAWQPPGQGDLAIADAPVTEAKPKRKPRARTLQQPNHADIQTDTLASRRSLANR